jgi:BirA family transcriptional regulator, biotin operon repressor / biotin---[acetyl-CoA-carboxylase] ligase
MKTIGHRIIRFETTESTNLFAEELLKQGGAEEGTLIITRHQTAGRGQAGRSWESEAGKNLTLTIILHPAFLPADRQFLLNKAICLGICDFVSRYIPEVKIKWPNDIYADVMKIGGILIQHLVTGTTLENSLVGIGLNLNQEEFPKDLPNPASIKQVTGTGLDPEQALSDLCDALDDRYVQLKGHRVELLDRDYHARLLGAGDWRMFLMKGTEAEARITGVDGFGRLLLEQTDGRVIPFGHGEAFYFI